MLVVKSVVKYVKFSSNGMVYGVHAVDIGLEQNQET
jgi:hypothetical protein